MVSEEPRGCFRTYVGPLGISRAGGSKLRSASSEFWDSGAMLRRARSLAAKVAADSKVTDCSEPTSSHGDGLGAGISASSGQR